MKMRIIRWVFWYNNHFENDYLFSLTLCSWGLYRNREINDISDVLMMSTVLNHPVHPWNSVMKMRCLTNLDKGNQSTRYCPYTVYKAPNSNLLNNGSYLRLLNTMLDKYKTPTKNSLSGSTGGELSPIELI